MTKYKGFTLIELLVVIGVFLLMVAFLTPFVQITRHRKARIACATNLRKISLGLHLYASDNKGAFPEKLGELYPNYVEDDRAFDCPETKTIGTPNNPDYNYTAGLTESSGPKKILVEDINNHKKFKKNILRLDGSVDWAGVKRW